MSEKDVDIDLDSGEEIVATESEQVEEHENEEDEREHVVNDSNDSELDNAEDDNEREAIRERRREERKNRKQAQREREDSLRRELAARDAVINELRSKVDGIERRNSGSELAQLENAKRQTAQAYNYFKDQIRIATEAGNGAAVAEATEKLIQSQRKFDELTNYENAMRRNQAAPPPLDTRLVNHAQQWMSKNKWYDPTARDQDSRVTMTIDQQLAQEGWDPTTAEYWQELDTRIKKYLPHRTNSGKSTTTKPRSVVTGGGREASSAQSSGSYKLSSDRVQALKDAGIWDDPKQRAEAVKRFREYDKQHQG